MRRRRGTVRTVRPAVLLLALAGTGVACDDGTGSAPLPVRVTGSPSPPPHLSALPSALPAPLPDVRTGPPAAAPEGAAGGDCPASGVRVTAGPVEAAMGLRAMGVELRNCGTRPFEVSGYPVLDVLDERRADLGVEVREGTRSLGDTPSPSVLVLEPGRSAAATVVWRNTVTRSDVVATNGAYLRVTPAPGVAPQTVAPGDGGPLDLGNTGAVEVTAWAPRNG